MAVTGFQYTSTVALTGPAGPVQAMEFVMSTAAMTKFGLLTPCTSTHVILIESMPVTSQATAGSLVIDATELTATINGTAVDWTVVSPPPTHPLAGDTGTLTAVTITTVAASAATFAIPGYATTATAC